MKIGELARKVGCSVETIRYYEREGLITPPPRTQGNYRSYGPQHIEPLVFIINCRNLDMTHDEIKRLLTLRQQPENNCANINSLVDEHIEHVETRITNLQRLHQQLSALRERCQSAPITQDCAIVQQLSQPDAGNGHLELRPSHVGNSHKD